MSTPRPGDQVNVTARVIAGIDKDGDVRVEFRSGNGSIQRYVLTDTCTVIEPDDLKVGDGVNVNFVNTPGIIQKIVGRGPIYHVQYLDGSVGGFERKQLTKLPPEPTQTSKSSELTAKSPQSIAPKRSSHDVAYLTP